MKKRTLFPFAYTSPVGEWWHGALYHHCLYKIKNEFVSIHDMAENDLVGIK